MTSTVVVFGGSVTVVGRVTVWSWVSVSCTVTGTVVPTVTGSMLTTVVVFPRFVTTVVTSRSTVAVLTLVSGTYFTRVTGTFLIRPAEVTVRSEPTVTAWAGSLTVRTTRICLTTLCPLRTSSTVRTTDVRRRMYASACAACGAPRTLST